jgi:N12 class adenine-specific DNA methylase
MERIDKSELKNILDRFREELRAIEVASSFGKAVDHCRGSSTKEEPGNGERKIFDLDSDEAYLNPYALDPKASAIEANSPEEGLLLSLANLGRVDIEYIAKVSSLSPKKVISSLKGSIYQNPETWGGDILRGWETSDEYLSGSISRKLDAAQKADRKHPGYFSENVEALLKVMPKTAVLKDVYISLGSPWIPIEVIQDFVSYITYRSPRDVRVWRDKESGLWHVTRNTDPWCCSFDGPLFTKKWGTRHKPFLELLRLALNLKTPVVRYEDSDCRRNPSRVKGAINVKATMEAVEKQRLIIEEFKRWIPQSKRREEMLLSLYHERFGSIRNRRYDGSLLPFKGLSPEVTLYGYQKDAAARIIFNKNTLLAHDVGAGKTFVMVAAAMEMRRIGMAKKNLFVVPNNVVKQWEGIFKTMYPDASILVIGPSTFGPKKREAVLKELRDGDYDGIVIAYSCFNMIPMSPREKGDADEKGVDRVRPVPSQILPDDQDGFTGDIEDKRIYFDGLGIDRLFVDEAHNFKNLPFKTKMGSVLGLNPTGSKVCQELYEKVRFVQRGGGGVIFATGTPITNSISDIYTMQRYLQPGQLELMELSHFDDWVGNFASVNRGFEVDVDTNTYRMANRLSEFHNLPELSAMIGLLADFHAADGAGDLPDYEGPDDILVPQNEALAEYLKKISQRAEMVRARKVSPDVDNLLKITTDGRKAALDMRLVDPRVSPGKNTKLFACANQVADIYYRNYSAIGVQLVFCDTSVPSSSWNVYDELRRMLVNRGVKDSEIAYVHEATSDAKRDALFAKVRKGEIRVLLGSTIKLGLGVNVQEHLVALHHLDIPWRPADMVQREGRILRQGNVFDKVRIFRYVAQGSFDAYSWQLLETKQRFISSLLAGQLAQRDGDDMGSQALSYGEVKALALGNPLIRERVETANELTRYLILQKSLLGNKQEAEAEAIGLVHRIASVKEDVRRCEIDASFAATQPKPENEERAEYRQKLAKTLLVSDMKPDETKAFTYRGFDVVIPAGMPYEEPSCFLRREGSYRVMLGGGEAGNLVRIDNFIDKFDNHLQSLNDKVALLENHLKQAKAISRDKKDYSAEIAACRTRLKNIDEQLGVTK